MHHTSNEILTEFANLTSSHIIKNAVDVVDYANAIGGALAADIGIQAALGAIAGAGGLGSGIASALTGTQVAVSAGAGTGALMALSGLLAPFSIALGLAGVGYVIYQTAKITDDNIDDLVDRLDDLDPANNRTAAQLEKIKKDLLAFKPYISLNKVPEDPRERVRLNKQKLNAFTYLHKYLADLYYTFPKSIMPNLTDIGIDPQQALNAISKTLNAMEKGKEAAKKAVQEESRKAIKQYGNKINRDLKETGQKVVDMFNTLTKRYGKAPTFDNDNERSGYKLAQKLTQGTASLKDVKENAQNLLMVSKLLEDAIRYKKAHVYKQALTLPDGTQFSPSGIAKKEPTRQPKQKVHKSPVVSSLQKSINYLNRTYKTGIPLVKVDGIYGPKTASALQGFLNKNPSIAQRLNITTTDHKQIASNIGVLKSIQRSLSELIFSTKEPEPKQPKTTVEYGGGIYDVQEKPTKWNPTGAEILAALNNRLIDGTPARVWLENRGFSTRESQIEVAKEAFKGPHGIPPAKEWSMPALKSYVEGVYGKGKGRYSLSNLNINIYKSSADTLRIKELVYSLWQNDQGPVQNLLRLAENAPGAFDISDLVISGANDFLSPFDYNLEKLGKKIDDSGIGSSIIQSSNKPNRIIKEAFVLSVLLKAVGGLKWLAKIIWKIAKWTLLAMGAKSIHDVYNKVDESKKNNDKNTAVDTIEKKYPSLDLKNYGPYGYMGAREQ